jgi:hypothetical protein
MVEHAEKDGTLIPGKSVVIEPTSEFPLNTCWSFTDAVQVVTRVRQAASQRCPRSDTLASRDRSSTCLCYQRLPVGSARRTAELSSDTPFRCIITLPAKMSLEKEAMLRALGAEIVRTP